MIVRIWVLGVWMEAIGVFGWRRSEGWGLTALWLHRAFPRFSVSDVPTPD